MMIELLNEVLTGFDENKCTIVLFLDLSAAFDTIDITKLFSILEKDIGIRNNALKWFKSYLTERSQKVKINGYYSDSQLVKFGVTQGSVFGPRGFNYYVRLQPKLFNSCGFKTSSFADDTNGRKTFSLSFQYNIMKNEIPRCI